MPTCCWRRARNDRSARSGWPLIKKHFYRRAFCTTAAFYPRSGENNANENRHKKNTYFDSVSLMSVSTKANKLPGVEQAFVAMATEMNKGVLKNLGLLTPELAKPKTAT
jgi:hypothetical protein